MPIIIDHQLREQITHDASVFPITYFHDELATLPNWAGPLHWHHEFEIATAESGILDFQVGQKHLTLEAGDSIFINGNILHGIRQVAGDVPDPMPNIVFSDIIFAPGTSVIYEKYIRPIAGSDALPFIMFRHGNSWHNEVNRLVEDIYCQLRERNACYEMVVQRDLNSIFEYLFRHFDDLPKFEATRIQINTQIRIQQMLTYIYTHYADSSGNQPCLRFQLCKLFQPPIPADLWICTWSKTHFGKIVLLLDVIVSFLCPILDDIMHSTKERNLSFRIDRRF